MINSPVLQNAAAALESGEKFLTEGGAETWLAFRTEFPLRHEAAFEALFNPKWNKHLADYAKMFGDVGIKYKKSVMLDTSTWRASKHWYDQLGISQEDRKRVIPLCVEHSVATAEELEKASNGAVKMYVQGIVGPRADAYTEDKEITVEGAREYHREQIEELKRAGITVIAAMTLTTTVEAIGIVKEAERAQVKCIISFTVDTDGLLPSGQRVGEAIERVEKETGGAVMFYMLNCVHPKYVRKVLEEALQKGENWVGKFRGIRGNGSAKTHDELDDCAELDEGVPEEWAKDTFEITKLVPNMTVVGGCCGTGPQHCEELAKLLA